MGTVGIGTIGELLVGGDATGDIIVYHGNLGTGITIIRAGGSILGNLLVPNGRIGFIRADVDIGTPGSPIRIEAMHGVQDIALAINMYADIKTRINGGSGEIRKIEVDNFTGSLDAQMMGDQNNGGFLIFNESLNADITFGGSFTGANRRIEVPVGGLTTQIIFNADNNGWNWNSDVKIGFDGDPDQIILVGPGYTTTAADLGGGSVGLAPFDLHDESCAPTNGETVLLRAADPSLTVKLRHYGPITLNANAPVAIERRLSCSADPFVLVQAIDFLYSVDPNDARSLLISGAIGADGFEIGYEYRITPEVDLMCDKVSGNPAVSWDSLNYNITIRQSCLADLDSSGEVGTSDLLILFANWGPCSGCDADLDCDGDIDTTDLLLLFSAWGPCGAGSTSSQGGIPQSVNDCINRYLYGYYDLIALEACLEAVQE